MSYAISVGSSVLNNTAVSEESSIINDAYASFLEHREEPISRQRDELRVRFLTLKAKWEAETAMLSSTTEISMHPAYQQIIGMGPSAVPLILSEMKKELGHWFWALKSITGEDPVPPEQRGRIKEMTKAWLRWGRENGYHV